MKDKNFITSQGWMVNQLKLSGNDLLVYAIIYGFSQDEESSFKGSSSYLANCLNISRRSIFDILNRLVTKGLILKEERTKNGLKYCDYRTPKDPQHVPPNSPKGNSAESSQGSANSSHHIDLDSTKDTSAATDLRETKITGQADPETAAADEIDFLKQTFRRLDASLIFDEAFYNKARAFMNDHHLDSAYLAWLYELCLQKKPQNLAGYYFKIFREMRFVELYREASRPPPPAAAIKSA